MVTLTEYQEAAMRTWDPALTRDQGLALVGLGLGGESGEVTDEIKKILFHARNLDRDKLIEEAGDVLWYLAGLANVLGTTLHEMAARNIAKLQKRHPNGFTPGQAKVPAAPSAPQPTEKTDAGLTVTIRALHDIPPFLSTDGRTIVLKAGDIANVTPGVADLLQRRGKASRLEVVA